MSEFGKMAKERMQKCIQNLNENYANVRTGRANPHVLDAIKVDYYGTQTPINQVASVKVSEGTTLVVEPWDKSVLTSVEQAIQESDLGINPNNDGTAIRLPFPKPTEDRRKELVKECKAFAEEAKVAVRNVRRDVNGKISRAEELSKDDQHREENIIQKETDAAIAEIEKVFSAKEKEIMEI